MSCGSIGPRNECFPMTIWFAAQATIVAADIRHVGNDNPDMIEFGSKVFPRTKSGKPCRSPATKKGRCRLHGGSFTIPVVVHEHTCGLQSGCTSSPIISRRVQTIREHNERTGVSLHPVPIERRTVMASRDAVDEKVTAALGADTRSITSSCYRVYFAEFRRKSRPTMGVLPGLACASILNANSSCPSWLSWLIR